MGVWDWVIDFNRNAEETGDRERQRLLQLFENASNFNHSDPDVMLGLLAEGRALAQALNEPWWVLFFDHWRLQALLHFKCDYRTVPELATKSALEARKPLYSQLPQRVCLHEDLIYAFVGTDPEGHQERIRQALDYMSQEVGPDLDCRYCVQGCRARFAMECGRPEEAQAAANQLLAMTDAESSRSTADHFAMDAYDIHCDLAFQRGDWKALAEWATAGEEAARRRAKDRDLAKFLAWQALLARIGGQEDRARRLARGAASRIARLKSVPAESYFDGLCAYHEKGGELEDALRLRDQELATVVGKDRLLQETRCRIKRCRLLAQMGRLTPEDVIAARTAAARLRHPKKYLADIEGLVGSQGG
jgi:hypothetical protein